MTKTSALRSVAAALLSLGAVLAFAGCAQSGTPGGGDATSESPAPADVAGLWQSDEPGEPHLEFTEDGEVSGTDGCNGISTTYAVDGDSIVLEDFVSTLMACQGVDTWLRDVKTVHVSGDTMTVENRDGTEIGTLHRAS